MLNTNKTKTILLIAIWAISCCVVFWWYQFRLIRAFSDTPVLFDALDLAAPKQFKQSDSIKIVHFWQSNCPCNAFNKSHLERILQNFKGEKIELFVASQGDLPKNWIAHPYTQLDQASHTALYQLIPSSPGLAIWSKNNQLSYFGPYSVGPICTEENSFISLILQELIDGQQPKMTTVLGNGCFCSWPGYQKG